MRCLAKQAFPAETYLARWLTLALSEPRVHKLDQAFNAFMAHTLSFEQDYDTGLYRATCPTVKGRALSQVRLSIKQGGFGVTRQELVDPAALFVAIRDFHRWLLAQHFTFHSCQCTGSKLSSAPNSFPLSSLPPSLACINPAQNPLPWVSFK